MEAKTPTLLLLPWQSYEISNAMTQRDYHLKSPAGYFRQHGRRDADWSVRWCWSEIVCASVLIQRRVDALFFTPVLYLNQILPFHHVNRNEWKCVGCRSPHEENATSKYLLKLIHIASQPPLEDCVGVCGQEVCTFTGSSWVCMSCMSVFCVSATPGKRSEMDVVF